MMAIELKERLSQERLAARDSAIAERASRDAAVIALAAFEQRKSFCGSAAHHTQRAELIAIAHRQLAYLSENFTEVICDIEMIELFDINAVPEFESRADLPRVVHTLLNSETRVRARARQTKTSSELSMFFAPLPVFPLLVTQLKNKVLQTLKALAGDLTEYTQNRNEPAFSLLYETEWMLVPQTDPILLVSLVDPSTSERRFFKLAQWGGDVDLLNEFVLES